MRNLIIILLGLFMFFANSRLLSGYRKIGVGLNDYRVKLALFFMIVGILMIFYGVRPYL